MKLEISKVDYLNEIFPLTISPDEMPVSLVMDDLKEGILELTKMTITMDRTERETASEIICNVAGAYKLMEEMRQAVLEYGMKIDNM